MSANSGLQDLISRGSNSRPADAAGLSSEQLAAHEAGLLAELLEAAISSCRSLSPYERDLIWGTAAMAQMLVSDSYVPNIAATAAGRADTPGHLLVA